MSGILAMSVMLFVERFSIHVNKLLRASPEGYGTNNKKYHDCWKLADFDLGAVECFFLM